MRVREKGVLLGKVGKYAYEKQENMPIKSVRGRYFISTRIRNTIVSVWKRFLTLSARKKYSDFEREEKISNFEPEGKAYLT